MKCHKCGTFLTANTISNCPGCGKRREDQERRAMLWFGTIPVLVIGILTWIITGLLLAA